MSIPHTGSFTTVVLVILISPSFVTFGSLAGQMLIGRFQQLIPHWLLLRRLEIASAAHW
jgi:hypothetical protein